MPAVPPGIDPADADAIDAVMDVAQRVAAGDLDAGDLVGAAVAECRRLFGRVEGPDDALWELHVDVARQVLAVGGGISADELAEWAAVYRAADEAAAEVAAEVAAGRGPSWIEQALAEDDGAVSEL